MTVQIKGLNLERLLCEAQKAGVRLYAVRRSEARCICAQISAVQFSALSSLCDRFGWTVEETRADWMLRLLRVIRARAMLFIGAAICVLMIAVSSKMVLRISVDGAPAYDGQVRRLLAQAGVRPGRMKDSVSFDALREELLLRLPGLTQAELRFAGSTLVVRCYPAQEGERTEKLGTGSDLVAACDGIVTGIVVTSGTPAVQIGDAVFAGQVLIRGEEAAAQGEKAYIRAQGQVKARVFAQGSARASLLSETARETGRVRTRVTIGTPWHEHVVQEAKPFEAQNETVRTERIIDLFIPLWRRTQVFEEVVIERIARTQADAAGMAQGAAENMAKKQLPAGVLILDKWVDYSMIDNEFVCADVVLEYERDIAVRPPQE